MGTVYRAHDLKLNREVALKVLIGGSSASDEHIVRFQREARSIAMLKHPHIIPIFDVGEVDGTHFFTMEFVHGRNLEEVIRCGDLSIERKLRTFVQVCRALQFAHDKGIIHRDIKPHNIIVDKNHNARVTDFGLARDIESGTKITVTGMTMGTPPYMSPEQARGQIDELDNRSDIYSLGATLYEMLSGRLPYDGASGVEIMIRILEEDPVPLRKVDSSIPRPLQTICLMAMARDPRRRYASADAMARDIERFLRGQAVHARPPRGRMAIGISRLRKKIIENVVLALFVVALLAVGSSYIGTSEYRDIVGTHLKQPVELPPLYVDDFNRPKLADRPEWRLLGDGGIGEGDDSGRLLLKPRKGETAAVLLNTQDVFSGYRKGTKVEFEVYIPNHESGPGEICVFILSDCDAFASELASEKCTADDLLPYLRTTGYHFALGADGNTHHLLLREGRIVRSDDRTPLRQGRTMFRKNPLYHMEVKKEGWRVSFTVNGEEVLSFRDDFPPRWEPREYAWGFYTTGPGMVLDDISVSKIGVALSARPADTSDDHFFLGNYRTALERYKLVRDCFSLKNTADSQTSARAAYSMALCKYHLWRDKVAGTRGEVEKEFFAVISSDSTGVFSSRAGLFLARHLKPSDPAHAEDVLSCLSNVGPSLRNPADLFCMERGLGCLERARGEWRKIAEMRARGTDPRRTEPAALERRLFLEAALSYLRRVTAVRSSDRFLEVVAHLLQGQILQDLGRLEASEAAYRVVKGSMDLFPRMATVATLELGRLWRRGNDDQRAVNLLWEAYGETDEGSIEGEALLLEIARTYRKIGSVRDALDIYQGILARARLNVADDLAALVLLESGMALAEGALSGEPEKRADTHDQARERWREAATKYRLTLPGPALTGLFRLQNPRTSLPVPLLPDLESQGLSGALALIRKAQDPGTGDRPVGLGLLAALFLEESQALRDKTAKLLASHPNALVSYGLGVMAQLRGNHDDASAFYKAVWSEMLPRAWPYSLSLVRLREIRIERKG
jgi:tetratricopeptide (TPR) repeat protein/predicted Ser/Thr protein kinase